MEKEIIGYLEKAVETNDISILNDLIEKLLKPSVKTTKKLLIRSAPLVSGDKVKHISKVMDRDVDIVIFNLEDGVEDKKKSIARKILRIFITNLSETNGKMVVVRINPIDSPFFFEDITEILPSLPHGIRLSKVRSKGDVIALDKIISAFEKKENIEEGTIKIHLSIETKEALENLSEILSSSKRIEAAYLGILDLFSDLKIPQNHIKSSPTSDFIKSKFVTICRTFNVIPVAPAYQEYKDLEGFEKECEKDKLFGFIGKSCISVKQTEIANRVFSPSPEEIEKAEKIVKLYEEALKEGKGGITFEGLFIDQPIYKDALNILNQFKNSR